MRDFILNQARSALHILEITDKNDVHLQIRDYIHVCEGLTCYSDKNWRPCIANLIFRNL